MNCENYLNREPTNTIIEHYKENGAIIVGITNVLDPRIGLVFGDNPISIWFGELPTCVLGLSELAEFLDDSTNDETMAFKESSTDRGFKKLEFADFYKSKCSIQESSLATDDAIWFGIDDPEPVIMASQTQQGGTGFVPYQIPDDVILKTRMHLTREQVKGLLPILKMFVDTGRI
jgi:hypothetical protein